MNRRAERGFTSVEMPVVITIIGMLIGLVITVSEEVYKRMVRPDDGEIVDQTDIFVD